jgi:hypothetical protein
MTVMLMKWKAHAINLSCEIKALFQYLLGGSEGNHE